MAFWRRLMGKVSEAYSVNESAKSSHDDIDTDGHFHRRRSCKRSHSLGSADDAGKKLQKRETARFLSRRTDIEQDLLSAALQANLVDLIESLDVVETLIIDSMLRDGCLTTDEYQMIRKRTRVDQIRLTIDIVKGRSSQIIRQFLGYIEKQNGDTAVVDEIRAKYEDLKKNKLVPFFCVLCRIRENVSVTYVCDKLHQNGYISAQLFSRIAACDEPAGNQDHLWTEIFKSCNTREKTECLADILGRQGHYTHLAEELRRQSDLQRYKLKCACSSTVTLNLIKDYHAYSTASSIGDQDSSSTAMPASTPNVSTDLELDGGFRNEDSKLSCMLHKAESEQTLMRVSNLGNLEPIQLQEERHHVHGSLLCGCFPRRSTRRRQMNRN